MKVKDLCASYLVIVTLLSLGLLMSAGCQENALRLKIRFHDAGRLVKGDRVVSDGQEKIGVVEGVTYTERGDFLVSVAILEKFKDSITTESDFYITDDPEREGKAAVGVTLSEGMGTPLQEGAVVTGTSKLEVMAAGIWKDLESTLKEFQEGVKELSEKLSKDLRELPKSEEFNRLKRQMDRLAGEMKKAGREAKEKLQKEVIPKIEEEIQELKRWLERQGREGEIRPLEVQLKQLKEI